MILQKQRLIILTEILGRMVNLSRQPYVRKLCGLSEIKNGTFILSDSIAIMNWEE